MNFLLLISNGLYRNSFHAGSTYNICTNTVLHTCISLNVFVLTVLHNVLVL